MRAVEPLISVVIPARNAEATLGDTLHGLAQQDFSGPFEVIVVDDGSTDSTRSVALAATIEVRVLSAEGGKAGAARNQGAAAATAPVLAFTDADCMPSREWLREGLRALDEADLVHGPVVPDSRKEVGVFDRTLGVKRETGLYETANLFVTRDAFESVGGFEDWLFTPRGMTFGEDSLFGWKLRRAGGITRFASRPVVEHAVFRRGPRDYVRARADFVCVPALIQRMPELRRGILVGGLFLSAESIRFDIAVAGALMAIRSRSAAPLIVAAPYGVWLSVEALRQRRNAPLVAAAKIAADAVRLGALVFGSIRYRSPVI